MIKQILLSGFFLFTLSILNAQYYDANLCPREEFIRDQGNYNCVVAPNGDIKEQWSLQLPGKKWLGCVWYDQITSIEQVSTNHGIINSTNVIFVDKEKTKIFNLVAIGSVFTAIGMLIYILVFNIDS